MADKAMYRLVDQINRWFAKHIKDNNRIYGSWANMLAYDYAAGAWKRERNRRFMSGVLRDMRTIRDAEFYAERQRLMAENYPKPS